jgi:hypothetical protein
MLLNINNCQIDRYHKGWNIYIYHFNKMRVKFYVILTKANYFPKCYLRLWSNRKYMIYDLWWPEHWQYNLQDNCWPQPVASSNSDLFKPFQKTLYNTHWIYNLGCMWIPCKIVEMLWIIALKASEKNVFLITTILGFRYVGANWPMV